jgi:CheY-like chemotaxis protein
MASPVKPKEIRRVLVVEDDLDLLTVLETVLKSIDPAVQIDWATSAENAIIQLKETKKGTSEQVYDLIVADIFLNGESTGIDLWNQCNQICPKVPVVIMSSLPLNKYLTVLGPQAISPPFLEKPLALGECRQLFEGMFSYSRKVPVSKLEETPV